LPFKKLQTLEERKRRFLADSMQTLLRLRGQLSHHQAVGDYGERHCGEEGTQDKQHENSAGDFALKEFPIEYHD
jgi:hypothetical protein